ncbi:MAG TPA: hypothetical protein VFV71_01630 [Burkholderiales bacterium]|nr:hypothetical protein [Burkholderiales bacterium]
MNPGHDLRNGAFLRFSEGRVVLCMNDMQFGANDVLPASLQGPAAREPANARHFVNACMIIEYGRNETVWPELARRFVSGG